uniref:Uncharacterized protein n=1 Tax=Cucumis melo TaxID=3656 RepID=A0A9I9D1Q8_CUCME
MELFPNHFGKNWCSQRMFLYLSFDLGQPAGVAGGTIINVDHSVAVEERMKRKERN